MTKENKKEELNFLEEELSKLCVDDEEYSLHMKYYLSLKKITSKELWDCVFKNSDISIFEKRVKYLLSEFGTKKRCNRFDVGNTIEFLLTDFIKLFGLEVKNSPDDVRTDLEIVNYPEKISCKYSSSGDIKIHNSLGQNKDMYMHPTIIIKPDYIYFITYELLKDINLDLSIFLKNTIDGLSLKQSILKKLHKLNYYYIKKINITPQLCKHRSCSELIYKYIVDNVK